VEYRRRDGCDECVLNWIRLDGGVEEGLVGGDWFGAEAKAEEVEVSAGGVFGEGEEGLELEEVEEAGGLAVGEGGVDKAEGEGAELAAVDGFFGEDFEAGVAGVALDGGKGFVEVEGVAFEHVEEGAGVVEEDSREAVGGVVGAGFAEQGFEVSGGEGVCGDAAVEELLHEVSIGQRAERLYFVARVR
jgi:hypothetical protein